MRVANSVTARLRSVIEMARPELIAALLTNGAPKGWNMGWGYVTSECLLYCLLEEDWANLTEVAEAVPGAKARLIEILHISDAEWDELRSDEKLVDDPYAASSDYHDTVVRAIEPVRLAELEVA
jgi:hypothetical protein